MKVSFIGYGSMADALAGRWAKDHEVFIGGRDPAKAKALAGKVGAAGSGGGAAAAAFGEVVVLATPHEAVFDAIDGAGGPAAFAGKVVVDINNPVPGYTKGDFLVTTYDGDLSLAEAIQKKLSGARVVKAFNMCQAKVWQMDPPTFDGRRLVTLMAGNDAAAKGAVGRLVEAIGGEPVDAGELKYARLLEASAALVIKFLMSGRDPRTVLNLIQPESKPV